jgi:hypothetical protein
VGITVVIHACIVTQRVFCSLASVSASQWNSRYSVGGGGTSVTGGAFDDDADHSGCGFSCPFAPQVHILFRYSEQHVKWLQEQVSFSLNILFVFFCT